MNNDNYLGAKFNTGMEVKHGLNVYYLEVISREGVLISYHTFMSHEAVINKIREIRLLLRRLKLAESRQKAID